LETCGESDGDWAAFYLANRQGLAVYARALMPNAADAQDLIQDVLVRMVRDQPQAKGARPLVFRAMRNLAIDRQRRRRLESETLLRIRPRFELPSPGRDPDLHTALLSALDALADEQREVIVLRTYAELTFEEIAEATGRPAGTLASQYARGLKSLGIALAREERHAGT